MKDFYNDFSKGGWDAYFNMLQPNNNFYSELMSTQDAMAVKASNQQAATQAQSAAAQGFKGTRICADGSDPDGTSCVDSKSGEYLPKKLDGTCGAGETLMPNGGLCADGTEPKTTTPGQITAGLSAKVLGSNIDLIVNANSLTGIAVAMTESLMNTLVSGAINGNGLAGAQPSPPPASSTPQPIPLSCTPQTETISIGTSFTMGATGGNPDTSGNITYTWAAPGATPTSFIGPIFSGVYNATGTYNIYLIDPPDSGRATCSVVVQ